LAAYLKSTEFKPYRAALDFAIQPIDGFESPFGMELLSSVDWLLQREGCEPNIPSIQAGLRQLKTTGPPFKMLAFGCAFFTSSGVFQSAVPAIASQAS
jgi:hypothetical protein